ncbi:MAG: replicative DNA helicase [Candidatus Thermochlorobacter sp.]
MSGGGFIDRSQETSGTYPLEKLLKSRRSLKEGIDFAKEGRMPPSAVDVEQEVLGCILLDGHAIEEVIKIFGSDAEKVFYEPKHSIIFKAMCRLYNRRDPIDIVSVSDELKRHEELDKVGGYYAIAELSNKVATAANVSYYAKLVKEKYLYRRLIALSTNIISAAYDQSLEVFDLIEQAAQEIFRISQTGIKKDALLIKDLLKQATKVIEELQARKSAVTGVPSGFADLDRLTAGFQKSDMIIIAARPSTGKTALALSFARHAAVEARVPVLFFSLEMAELQLAQRMLCAEAMVDSNLVRTGRISSQDMVNIMARMDKLAQAPIFIDDTPGISIIELSAKARRMKQEHNIGMVIIDYLQLITPVKDGKSNREQEIAQISRSLKSLAKELNIPVVSLAQLNRSIEQRGADRKPQLSDLRESGSIEQDADVVIFLSRPELYGVQNFPDGLSTKDIIVVDIGKQRNGPIGEVRLKFLKQFGKFESLSSVYTAADFSVHDEQRSQQAAERLERDALPPKPPETLNPDDAPF